ncbi:Homeotic protein spalt-major, partial [Stegodyphus mimosarum]
MDTEEDDDPDDLDDRLSPPQLNNEQNDNDKPLPPKDWFYGYSSGDIRSLLLCSQRPDSNVTLEQLKNTTVAVAQHSQFDEVHLRAFFSKFQQQQVESLQLIKTLEKMLLNSQPLAPPPLIGTAALTPPQNADLPPSVGSVSTPITSIMAAYPQGTTQESPGPPIPPPETNNLALLEKQTERYIQDVMTKRSFLINGIDDDNRSKNKKFEMDPAMRHRCNFCGKLLGSDSALQIHLRSHTGEKPFRCNVCGSAFSTRGNLKVHCQRHKERMELVGSSEELKLSTESNAAGAEGKQSPSMLFVHDGTNRGDISKGEQALDFSTSINGRRSPQGDANSRSISPNDMSNFSDNSADNSSDENTANDNYGDLKIDVERFDDDDRDNSNGLDDEGSEAASTRPSFGPSPTFSTYFLPSSYDNFTASASQTTGNNNNNPSNTDGSDTILQDPTYYQDLLPRIGSNDNSWESLIEVTKTSETSKLQQLVDNIEHKLIEPNQCIICHRVLSCKSALQMHYRTHTGERPFKCKLCSRAFTTKGNLKTHMGVHRTKPAARLMHQCPVCHKQFPNSVILQQHIRIHTGDPSVQMPPLYHSCEDRPPTLLPPSYPRQYLMPPQLMNNEPLALTSSKTQEQQRSLPTNESVIKTTGMDTNLPQTSCTSPELSATSSCSPSSNVDENSTLKEPKPPVLDLVQPHHDMSPKEKILQSPVDNSKANEMNITQGKETISGNSTPADIQPDFEANLQQESSPNHNQSSVSAVASQEMEDKSATNMSNKSSPKFSSPPENTLIVSLASDRPLPMTLPSDCPIPFTVHGSDRPYPPMSISGCAPEYTASLAALENHVKGINSNVTHPLPFPPHFGLGLNMANYFRDYNYPQKSTASSPPASKNGSDISTDDRSTPGGATSGNKSDSPRSNANNSQSTPKSESSNGGGALDLTPRSSPAFQRPGATDVKIFAPLVGLPFGAPHHRMSTTCRVCYKTFACNSALEIHYRSHTKERPFRCEVCDRGFSTKGNMRQHMLTHKIRDLPAQVFSANTTNNSSSSNTSTTLKLESSGEKSPKKQPEEAAKRPPTENSLPLPQPKRSPG